MGVGRVNKIKFTVVPRSWSTAPLFPPLPQTEKYVFSWGTHTWTSGCRLSFEDYTSRPTPYERGFDIRHFDLITALMTAYRDKQVDPGGFLKITYSGLLKLIDKSDGKKQKEYLCGLLDDLYHTDVLYEDTEKGISMYGRFLEKIITDTDAHGRHYLKALKVSEEFSRFMNLLGNTLFNVRYDVKNKMPSLIAQSLYLYIPSRACHHLENDPWTISLESLMRELSLPVDEKYKSKSLRYRCFTQHGERSIMAQLDGALLSTGAKMHVKLELNKDQSDYLFCAWVEPNKDAGEPPTGWLLETWQRSGRTKDAYYEALKNQKSLDWHDKDRLEKADLDVDKSEKFFTMVKTLLSPDDWGNLLDDEKSKALEGRLSKPFPYFCTGVINALNENQPILDAGLLHEELDQ